MPNSEPAPAVPRRGRAPDPPSTTDGLGITVYGCEADEAARFAEAGPRLGVRPTVVADPVSEANVELARGNRCVSVGHKTRIANATVRALAQVGVAYLSTRSIGCNHVNVEYAASVGVTVENTSYAPDGVADYALMLILMSLRHAKAMVRRTDLHDYRLHETRGRELRDLTVGVVGTGRIGAAVVDRLRGFGCRVLACDRSPAAEAEYVPLEELLRRSDVVTLHTPLNASTYHLLDRGRIDRMKPGALVVNTGRGALVDTEALIAALEGGRLGGAALDVVEGEEGVFYADRRAGAAVGKPILRLQELPNVIVSPHTAYHTDRALDDSVEHSIRNCLAFAGRERQGRKQHG